MTDGENTTQVHVGVHENGQVASIEPHRVHLLECYADLLAECHRHRRYLAVCGAELPVAALDDFGCCESGECYREVTYCEECVSHAAQWNAEVGLTADSPAPSGAGR